jgi:hypothetical protein
MECGQNGKATLRAAPKGTVDGAVGLTPEEDRLLREASGRYGGKPEARRKAASARWPAISKWAPACGCYALADRLAAAMRRLCPSLRRIAGSRYSPVHCVAQKAISVKNMMR